MYEVIRVQYQSGTGVAAQATVQIRKNGVPEPLVGTAESFVNSFDAVFRAVEAAVGYEKAGRPWIFRKYIYGRHNNGAKNGREAGGRIQVFLLAGKSSQHRRYRGESYDSDQLVAAAVAYVDAINSVISAKSSWEKDPVAVS